MDLKQEPAGRGGSAEVRGVKSLIPLVAEVGGSGESHPSNPLKSQRRRGGAEVPHTPYALPPALRARSAGTSRGSERSAP
jgi:hypothetical protein